MLILDSNTLANMGMGMQWLVSFLTVLISVVGGYIMIRERILKTELKIDATTNYIDRKNELIEKKIEELVGDINEFKQLNKDTTKSLIENTAAIRELKVVLDLLKEQLGLKAVRRMRKNTDNNV